MMHCFAKKNPTCNFADPIGNYKCNDDALKKKVTL